MTHKNHFPPRDMQHLTSSLPFLTRESNNTANWPSVGRQKPAISFTLSCFGRGERSMTLGGFPNQNDSTVGMVHPIWRCGSDYQSVCFGVFAQNTQPSCSSSNTASMRADGTLRSQFSSLASLRSVRTFVGAYSWPGIGQAFW